MLLRKPHEFSPVVEGMSPAVVCTVNLSLLAFAVYVVLAAAANVVRMTQGRRRSKFLEVMKLAAHTVFFAPMLCVLFIGARLRALQVDPEKGHPQSWAQSAFYMCTYALFLQTGLAIVVPYLPGGDAVKRGTRYIPSDIEMHHKNNIVRVSFKLLRHGSYLLMYAGAVVVMVSLYTVAKLSGRTPPVPPSMQCIIVLAQQFFIVYLGLWVSVVVQDITKDPTRGTLRGSKINSIVETLHSASATVHFCPMLAILFVALRLRAQQITRNTGSPQGWAQDAMYFCTGALFVQLLACLLTGVVTGKKPDVDENGSPFVGKDAGYPVLWRTLLGVQVFAFIAIYGGALAICVAMYTITPKTAGGEGAWIQPLALF